MSFDICISVKNKNQRSGNTASKVQTLAAVDTFSLFSPLICKTQWGAVISHLCPMQQTQFYYKVCNICKLHT